MRPESLARVIEHARRQRDHAARELAHALAQERHAQAQLQQLTDYDSESATQWLSRGAQGVSPALLAHRHAFDHKLQHAIDFQRRVVADSAQTVQRLRQALQAAERHCATLETLQTRAAHAAALAQRRREQKQLDDMANALLAHRRRQSPDAQAFDTPA